MLSSHSVCLAAGGAKLVPHSWNPRTAVQNCPDGKNSSRHDQAGKPKGIGLLGLWVAQAHKKRMKPMVGITD
jgi:hypothetical protein